MRNYLFAILILIGAGCSKKEELTELKNENQTSMSVKVLNPYPGRSATQINAAMSYTCEHAVVGNTVECSLIDIAPKVRNVIGAANYDVIGLCSHANVNKWSGFGPRTWIKSGNTITDTVRYPYELGSFAGYNHNALPPLAPTGSFSSGFIDFYDDEIISWTIDGNVGEINYQEIDALAAMVNLYIEKQSGNIFAISPNDALPARQPLTDFNSNPRIDYRFIKSEFSNMENITISLYVDRTGKVPNTSIPLVVRYCGDYSLTLDIANGNTEFVSGSGSVTWEQRGDSGNISLSVNLTSITYNSQLHNGTIGVEYEVWNNGAYRFVVGAGSGDATNGDAVVSGVFNSGNTYQDGDYLKIIVTAQ